MKLNRRGFVGAVATIAAGPVMLRPDSAELDRGPDVSLNISEAPAIVPVSGIITGVLVSARNSYTLFRNGVQVDGPVAVSAGDTIAIKIHWGR